MNNKREDTKKLQQFLGSEHDEIRALGIVTAIGRGMTPGQLAEFCVKKKWYRPHENKYNIINFPHGKVRSSYYLEDYNLYIGSNGIVLRKELDIIYSHQVPKKDIRKCMVSAFAKMIECYLDEREIEYRKWPQKKSLN